MADILKLTTQSETLKQWTEHIDTANARLTAAAGNANAAVGQWQAFAALASQEELTDTGNAVAVKLLASEDVSLNAIATLCRAFAGGTGQTTQQLLTKLEAKLQ